MFGNYLYVFRHDSYMQKSIMFCYVLQCIYWYIHVIVCHQWNRGVEAEEARVVPQILKSEMPKK